MEADMSHKKEPWKVDPIDSLRILSATGREVGRVNNSADAIRIIHCVNALKRVPNNLLESIEPILSEDTDK